MVRLHVPAARLLDSTGTSVIFEAENVNRAVYCDGDTIVLQPCCIYPVAMLCFLHVTKADGGLV